MKNGIWICQLLLAMLIIFSCKKDDSGSSDKNIKDIDGNVYTSVTIGTQTWMVENLKTTKYNDGTDIPNVPDMNIWGGLTTPGYCWHDNNTSNKIYGALYNWFVVNTSKLAPVGWHVPTDAEWTTLENYLIANGYNYDGSTGIYDNKIAKSLSSTTLWSNSTVPGAVGNMDYPTVRNKTNFTAIPGGYRTDGGIFTGGDIGVWWSNTTYSQNPPGDQFALYRSIQHNQVSLMHSQSKKTFGFSVRCIKN